jgi:WhiB family transcriptional regulator, redox-sensing transcriptional regulator
MTETEQHKWRESANCLDADPEIFFPVAGGNGLDAKRVCARCTVVDKCLQYALEYQIEDGVWGGVSAVERERMRKRMAA